MITNWINTIVEQYVTKGHFLVSAFFIYKFGQFIKLLYTLSKNHNKNNNGHFYDIVDNYEVEVSWQWLELTPEERDALSNGIGADSWPPEFCNALDEATGFRAASLPHDGDYNVYRTEDERLIADRRFFRNCLRILLQDYKGWLGLLVISITNTKKLKEFIRRLLIARMLYRALRVGGKIAFERATKLEFKVVTDISSIEKGG